LHSRRRGDDVLERYASVQDVLGIAVILGMAIKIYQLWKEGKFG
jgi:hypothetical protein